MRSFASRLSLLAAVFVLGAMTGFVIAGSDTVAGWRGLARADAAPTSPRDPLPSWASDAPPDADEPATSGSVPVPSAARDAEPVVGAPGPVAIGEPVRARDGGTTPRPTSAELTALRGALVVPVAGIARADLRSSFDEARGGGARVHQALDIAAPRGTPVVSAADGRVLKLFTSDAGGLMVYAADATGRFVLIYAHLDAYAPNLREGQALRRGDAIGTVGTTGNAPPGVPHLHFAIARASDPAPGARAALPDWWRGTPVDPYPLLAP